MSVRRGKANIAQERAKDRFWPTTDISFDLRAKRYWPVSTLKRLCAASDEAPHAIGDEYKYKDAKRVDVRQQLPDLAERSREPTAPSRTARAPRRPLRG